MANRVTRRTVLSGMAAGAASAAGALRPAAKPSERRSLGVAFIGVGGQGAVDLKTIASLPEVRVVALCDVDAERAAPSFASYPNVPKYRDYRKMLDDRRDIDAVVVTVPDHHHGAAALRALRSGRHVYCQKPLARAIAECRALRLAADLGRRVTQLGTQGHPSYARHVELIRSGILGAVHEVHVWTDRPIWPQGMRQTPEPSDPPAGLDWDLWLGPAASRPYSRDYLPFIWRGWTDFGTGALGDMGCHLCDPAFWALDLGLPHRVEANASAAGPLAYPRSSQIRFDFPAAHGRPAVRMLWYDGGKMPAADLLGGVVLPKGSNGSLFIGSKGKLLTEHGGPPRLLPERDFHELNRAEWKAAPPGHHYAEWVHACLHGSRTATPFAYAATMTEALLLGNLAIRLRKPIVWDAHRMRAAGLPEADPLIRPLARAGWGV